MPLNFATGVAAWVSPNYWVKVMDIAYQYFFYKKDDEIREKNGKISRLEEKVNEQTRKIDEQSKQIAEILGYAKETKEESISIREYAENIMEDNETLIQEQQTLKQSSIQTHKKLDKMSEKLGIATIERVPGALDNEIGDEYCTVLKFPNFKMGPDSTFYNIYYMIRCRLESIPARIKAVKRTYKKEYGDPKEIYRRISPNPRAAYRSFRRLHSDDTDYEGRSRNIIVTPLEEKEMLERLDDIVIEAKFNFK